MRLSRGESAVAFLCAVVASAFVAYAVVLSKKYPKDPSDPGVELRALLGVVAPKIAEDQKTTQVETK